MSQTNANAGVGSRKIGTGNGSGLRRRSALRLGAATGILLSAIAIDRASAADWPGADQPTTTWPAADSLRGPLPAAGYVRWDGISFGVQAGLSNLNTDFGNSSSKLVAYSLRNTTVESEFSPSSWTTLPGDTSNGKQYGAFIGYSTQVEQLVVGFDLAYNRVNTLQTAASDSIARQVTTSDGYVNQVGIVAQSSFKLLDYATLRGRAGYAIGQFLPYAMIGVAVGRANYSTTATTTVSGTNSSLGTSYGPNTDTQSNSKDNAFVGGLALGLGLDVALLPNVFVRGEWEYVAFSQIGGIRASVNTGRVGIGVKF